MGLLMNLGLKIFARILALWLLARRIGREKQGQDLVEYSLVLYSMLVAFIVLMSCPEQISTIWGAVGSRK